MFSDVSDVVLYLMLFNGNQYEVPETRERLHHQTRTHLKKKPQSILGELHNEAKSVSKSDDHLSQMVARIDRSANITHWFCRVMRASYDQSGHHSTARPARPKAALISAELKRSIGGLGIRHIVSTLRLG